MGVPPKSPPVLEYLSGPAARKRFAELRKEEFEDVSFYGAGKFHEMYPEQKADKMFGREFPVLVFDYDGSFPKGFAPDEAVLRVDEETIGVHVFLRIHFAWPKYQKTFLVRFCIMSESGRNKARLVLYNGGVPNLKDASPKSRFYAVLSAGGYVVALETPFLETLPMLRITFQLVDKIGRDPARFAEPDCPECKDLLPKK